MRDNVKQIIIIIVIICMLICTSCGEPSEVMPVGGSGIMGEKATPITYFSSEFSYKVTYPGEFKTIKQENNPDGIVANDSIATLRIWGVYNTLDETLQANQATLKTIYANSKITQEGTDFYCLKFDRDNDRGYYFTKISDDKHKFVNLELIYPLSDELSYEETVEDIISNISMDTEISVSTTAETAVTTNVSDFMPVKGGIVNYKNSLYGYEIDYPDIFSEISGLSDGSGLNLNSSSTNMMIWGFSNTLDLDLDERYQVCSSAYLNSSRVLEEENVLSFSFKEFGREGYYCERMSADRKYFIGFRITYLAEDEKMAGNIEKMIKSLKFILPETTAILPNTVETTIDFESPPPNLVTSDSVNPIRKE